MGILQTRIYFIGDVSSMFIDLSFGGLLRLFQLLAAESKKLFHSDGNIVGFSGFKTFMSCFVVKSYLDRNSFVDGNIS